MPNLVLTVASGFQVSSDATLVGQTGPLLVVVPSCAAIDWRIAMSADGGTTFGQLRRLDGTGAPFSVISGGGGALSGIVPWTASRFRIECVSGPSATMSVAITPLNRA